MDKREQAIGIFDSGVGGVSVLKELLAHLPKEKFIYYADTVNAPYGTKKLWEVQDFSLKVGRFLIEEKKVKALVIACNTATSAAVKLLRSRFLVPIIGMEPALKPAVNIANGGKIIVMATPMTLREVKFQELMCRYEDKSQIITLPCPGLVELIEAGHTKGKQIDSYLKNLFSHINTKDIQAVVLGCTHYLFIRDPIAGFFAEKVKIIDGNSGTIKQVARLLKEADLLSNKTLNDDETRVEWITSGKKEEILKLENFFLN